MTDVVLGTRDVGVDAEIFIDGLNPTGYLHEIQYTSVLGQVEEKRFGLPARFRCHLGTLRGGAMSIDGEMPVGYAYAAEMLAKMMGDEREPHTVMCAPHGMLAGRLVRLGKVLETQFESSIDPEKIIPWKADFIKTAASPGLRSGRVLLPSKGATEVKHACVQTLTATTPADDVAILSPGGLFTVALGNDAAAVQAAIRATGGVNKLVDVTGSVTQGSGTNEVQQLVFTNTPRYLQHGIGLGAEAIGAGMVFDFTGADRTAWKAAIKAAIEASPTLVALSPDGTVTVTDTIANLALTGDLMSGTVTVTFGGGAAGSDVALLALKTAESATLAATLVTGNATPYPDLTVEPGQSTNTIEDNTETALTIDAGTVKVTGSVPSASGADITTLGGSGDGNYTGSATDAGYGPNNGSVGTGDQVQKYDTGAGNGQSVGRWTWNRSGAYDGSPVTILLEGSNDDTNYATIDTATITSNSSDRTFSASTVYRYFRSRFYDGTHGGAGGGPLAIRVYLPSTASGTLKFFFPYRNAGATFNPTNITTNAGTGWVGSMATTSGTAAATVAVTTPTGGVAGVWSGSFTFTWPDTAGDIPLMETSGEATGWALAKTRFGYYSRGSNVLAATGNGATVTDIDPDETSVRGLMAVLQVVAATGGSRTLTVKLQHSADDGEGAPTTWADLITFDAVANRTAQLKTVASGITINPHLRWSVSAITGQFVVAIGYCRY